jgi:uncharacterized protein involved in exopolysaccharide biosynthesis
VERGDLRDYVGVLRRRGWIIAASLLLVAAAALALELSKNERYEATADVLLSSNNRVVPEELGNTPASELETNRVFKAQIALARIPLLAERVVQATGAHLTAGRLHASSTVTSNEKADTLAFEVRNGNAQVAQQLANEYARQFVIYQQRVRSAIGRERASVARRLALLESRGEWVTPLHTALLEKSDRLQAYVPLYAVHATVDRPASGAAKVQPLPVRAALIGLALGLFLGLGLALLWDALEGRLRTTEEKAPARGAA